MGKLNNGGPIMSTSQRYRQAVIVTATTLMVAVRLVMAEGFESHDTFNLVNPTTASTGFVNTNEVNLTGLTVPEGYDQFQFTESGDPGDLTTNWTPTNQPFPTQWSFPLPLPETDADLTLYAWFTNETASVALKRSTAMIGYTTAAPVAVLHSTLERKTAGFTIRLVHEEVNAGSHGGWFGGDPERPIGLMPIERIFCDEDATPGSAFVTLTSAGTYDVGIRLRNEAGTQIDSTVFTAVSVVESGDLPTGDRYVAVGNQNHASPYDTWATAAGDIQTAVTAASAGQTVRVAPGYYRRTSSPVVSINKSLQLRGAGDREDIVIDGESAIRCVQIAVHDTPVHFVIAGFSVINGAGVGGGSFSGTGKWPAGGIMLNNTTNVADTVLEIRNCIVTGCRSGHTSNGEGGGIMVWGFSDATDVFVHISGSEIVDNYSATGGGGIHLTRTRFLIEESRIAGNSVDVWDPFADPPVPAVNARGGGGISIQYAGPSSRIRNCIIEHNRSSTWGGGVLSRYDGDLTIENTILRDNVSGRGAGILISQHTGNPTNILRNCLIANNHALANNVWGNTGRGGAVKIGDLNLQAGKNVRIENCTIVDNQAEAIAGGIRIYTANGLTAVNTIVYDNWANGHVNSNYSGTAAGWYHCLVGTQNTLPGSDNITDRPPGFVDPATRNYRLAEGSPAINAGMYLPWMDTALDLDDKPRIHPMTGFVDIGAYAYQPRGSVILVR